MTNGKGLIQKGKKKSVGTKPALSLMTCYTQMEYQSHWYSREVKKKIMSYKESKMLGEGHYLWFLDKIFKKSHLPRLKIFRLCGVRICLNWRDDCIINKKRLNEV